MNNRDTIDDDKRGDGEIDSVTLEIIANRFDQIVREMEHIMYRSGYSTIIRDSKDGSAGICLTDGRVIGQARNPLHYSPYSPTIEEIWARFDADEIHEGDAFIVNDPYRCGSNHSPDMLAAVPVFYEDELEAWCINVAHKPDIGGLVPGSTSPDAKEIYHEGLLLPPVRYRRRGEFDRDIDEIIRNNCRIPDVTVGDIRGQVNCTNIGVEKMHALFDKYGVETIKGATDRIIDSTHKRVGRAIANWNGATTVRGFLDSYGDIDNPIEFVLEVRTEKGERTLIFDFTESDAQTDGPSNLRPPIVRSGCIYSMVGTIDPALPLNSGIEKACEFIMPRGSIVNPERPAPVGNYAKSVSVIVHLGLRALSHFTPAKAIAETGGKASVALGSRPTAFGDDVDDEGVRQQSGLPEEPDDDFVHFEIMGGGYGGHSDGDGSSCMGSSYESNIEFTPIEIVETEFDERVIQFSVQSDSAGAGKHRGGLGFIREYEALRPLHLTYRGSNHETTPKGVNEGRSPGNSRCVIDADGPDPVELDTLDTLELDEGDRVRLIRPGGGGFGDPYDRDPEKVLNDVLDGFVSENQAAEDYGVEIRDATSGEYRLIR